jgi:predicted PilT family ATPase
LKSDMLCSACNSKLQVGEITKADLAISRAIYSFRPDASFTSYIETKNFIIVLADKDNARKIIGKAGRNVKKMSEILKTHVKIVEIGPHTVMLEELLSVPVLAINKVYGNSESYRVRIEKKFHKRVRFPSSVAAKVINKPVEFIFE